MRVKITKRTADALRPGECIANVQIKGFVARRLRSGTVTYGYRFRNRAGQQRWLALGLHGQITPDQARDLAKKRAGEVADDRDPVAERVATRNVMTNTVNAVLDSFLARYVRKQGLRSADEIERTFKVYVRGHLGNRSIYDLRRRDIVELLDAIEDNNGPVMADRTLAYLRKAFNWHATRDDKFQSADRARHGTDEAEGTCAQSDSRRPGNPRYMEGARRGGSAGLLSAIRASVTAHRAETRRGLAHALGGDRGPDMDHPWHEIQDQN